MSKEEKKRKKANKLMEQIEKEAVEEVILASLEGEELPELSEEKVAFRFHELAYQSEYGPTPYAILFSKQRLVDWLAVACSILVLLGSIYIQRFEIGWMFSFVIFGSIFIKQRIATISSVLFALFYFLGLIATGYYLTNEQIWSSMIGINKIFKWSVLIAGVFSYIAFTLAVISGGFYGLRTPTEEEIRERKREQRGLAIVTMALIGMTISASALDVIYSAVDYFNYPFLTVTQAFLVESAGFFLALSVYWIFWYSIAYSFGKVIRRSIEKQKSKKEKE